MKIYLVRHGQCESNVIGRYNFVDEDINETGIKQAEDLREKIKECDLPKLFVHGDMDRALPYTLSEEVSNNCSNSTFKLIKGGEHTFMNSDDAINEAIKVTIDFINEVN